MSRSSVNILVILFTLLTARAAAQITVRGEWQPMPVRGAAAVITVPGLSLPGRAAGFLEWPLTLDGVSVLIEGEPCPIRGYVNDSITFLVPDHAQRARDWRKRTSTIELATQTARYEIESLICDSEPGLLAGPLAVADPNVPSETAAHLPVGLWQCGAEGFGVFHPAAPVRTSERTPTVVQVWGSGVRWATDMQVRLDCHERSFVVKATVGPSSLIGVETITFTLPPEAANAGRCELRVLTRQASSGARVLDVQ